MIAWKKGDRVAVHGTVEDVDDFELKGLRWYGVRFDGDKLNEPNSLNSLAMEQAKRLEPGKNKLKFASVLNYCEGHTDEMWAATIVAILLDCDFRESSRALKSWKDRR